MLYISRIIYLTGVALAIGCMLFLIALVGRHAQPVIDAPEYIPWTIVGFVFAIGIIFVAQALGNDLAPHLPNRHTKRPARPRVTRTPDAPAAVKPPPSEEAIAAYQKLQTRYDGELEMSHEEERAAYRTIIADMENRMTPQERAERDFLNNLDLTAGQCRLDIMPPDTPSDSWIGGLPSLPAGTAWPLIDWKPGLFLAQIALHDLPRETWGGQGPRSGWLVFFISQQSWEVTVLHTEERGSERDPVEVLDYPRWLEWDNAAVKAALGPHALLPPRWPLRITPADTPRPKPQGPDLRTYFKAFNPQEPMFQPFDWMTLVLMLQTTADQVKAGHRVQPARRASDPAIDAACHQVEATNARILPHLEALLTQTRRMAQSEPYSDALQDQILSTLARLTFSRPLFDNGKFVRTGDVPLLSLARNKQHANFFELHAKKLYCVDPAFLPDDLRSYMATVWANTALSEPAHIGTDGERFERGGSAMLLELPSSSLLDWMFGDASDLAITLPGKHLVSWDLTKAEMRDNHGI